MLNLEANTLNLVPSMRYGKSTLTCSKSHLLLGHSDVHVDWSQFRLLQGAAAGVAGA
jgi:hypothetical protein